MVGFGLHRNWKIHLIHHTHLDIGFTHTQEEVLKRQFSHLENAMDIIDENRNRPFAARFRWNPEATWVLEEWFPQASEANKKRFLSMVKDGYIGVDALFANLLTGLCRPEELSENFRNQKYFEELTGVKIDSAMISDIPGWNWGFVTALAENGIRYLSAGTNVFDRIGYALRDWGDRPFYWLSPSGKEKVLLFVHGKGYSWFHSLLQLYNIGKLKNKLKPGRVARYLRHLENAGYTYNTIVIRYNIGCDNGPPDANLSDIVENWNLENPRMQLVISTTSQAMADFERDYGHMLPIYQGDLTPYWEDGACSTAKETAITREASERLTQATTLAAMIAPQKYDDHAFHRIWNDILLYNEHTWGAYNSISKPDHSFAVSQWEWKRQRALHSAAGSQSLLTSATSGCLLAPTPYENLISPVAEPCTPKIVKELTVYNCQTWPVTQVVQVPVKGDLVTDDHGNPVPSQRLRNGHLAFLAVQVPPTATRKYRILDGLSCAPPESCSADESSMWNDRVKLTLDPAFGTIKNIVFEGRELVKQNSLERFNRYVFVSGKFASLGKMDKPCGKIHISVRDSGPLVSTIRIVRKGYKTNSITTDLTIENHSEKIFIHNLVDRPVSRRKEGIHFEFPFNLPEGRIKYDTIWGSAELDKDQLKGANKNFITATRWFDISNSGAGVSCALLDAPLFKSGKLIHDPFRTGHPKLCGWIRKTDYNGTVYSYIMNNYWKTNYKADQPGLSLFRYVFLPHGKYSEEMTHRFAIEQAQPLVSIADGLDNPESVLLIGDSRIICTSIKTSGNGLAIRLHNVSMTEVETAITCRGKSRPSVTSPDKDRRLFGDKIKLAPKETIKLFCRQ